MFRYTPNYIFVKPTMATALCDKLFRMKLQRFFGQFDLSQTSVTTVDKELINQIKNVFRYEKGDEVLLLDNSGKEALAKIAEKDGGGITFAIKKVMENANMPKNKVALYCSLLKKENFELVAQKATEIGVSEIFPLLSVRTLKQNINEERVKKIIKEASEQSERGSIPIIHPPLNFDQAIKRTGRSHLNILFNHDGENIENVKNPHDQKINIFIGPEGGWEDYEIASARENDFIIASLGKPNLRGETAAIVASYLSVNI